MRASLRLRAERNRKPDSAELEAAKRWLSEHGVSVLRVGRHALSIEAEREVLADMVDATLPISGPQTLWIDADQAAAGEWFDMLEYSPPPKYFD